MNSGGGTVTGYGLAAAQLTRFRDAGVKLTICVEQVAASGGYMMACVADRLVASPFAVLGSIGVITEQVAPPFATAGRPLAWRSSRVTCGAAAPAPLVPSRTPTLPVARRPPRSPTCTSG